MIEKVNKQGQSRERCPISYRPIHTKPYCFPCSAINFLATISNLPIFVQSKVAILPKGKKVCMNHIVSDSPPLQIYFLGLLPPTPSSPALPTPQQAYQYLSCTLLSCTSELPPLQCHRSSQQAASAVRLHIVSPKTAKVRRPSLNL